MQSVSPVQISVFSTFTLLGKLLIMSPNWPKRWMTKVTAVLYYGFSWSHNEN